MTNGESAGLESLRGVFGFADFHLSVWTFGHLHVDGSHHGLATVFVDTRLTVIEHIPLSVNLADAAVGVARGIGRGDGVAVGILLAGSSVDDGSTVGERT